MENNINSSKGAIDHISSKRAIAQGAEAVIYRAERAIVKDRIKKSYRISALDTNIRLSRTKNEAKLLTAARRAGVLTPQILEVSETIIKMENIEGELVKETLSKPASSDINASKTNINCKAGKASKLAYNIGQNIAKLHSAGIVHGDLTTSNMIVRNNEAEPASSDITRAKGELVIIDFGLGFFSKRQEDYAQDLAVLKEALKSTHYEIFDSLWKNIISGYKWQDSNNVFKVLESIEKRGRYIIRKRK